MTDLMAISLGFLIRDPHSEIRKKRAWVPVLPEGEKGDSAETSFRLLKTDGKMSLVEASPVTGRLHQIRATLCSLGYPLAGDKLYGPEEEIFQKIKTRTLTEEDYRKLRLRRQGLHAALLEFRHPLRGFLIRCESAADFL